MRQRIHRAAVDDRPGVDRSNAPPAIEDRQALARLLHGCAVASILALDLPAVEIQTLASLRAVLAFGDLARATAVRRVAEVRGLGPRRNLPRRRRELVLE